MSLISSGLSPLIQTMCWATSDEASESSELHAELWAVHEDVL